MNSIYKEIKEKGGRITKNRKAIISILKNACCFLSKEEIIKKLEREKIKPNRSTIYRELLFLTNNQIINKNTINGVDYFEISGNHHHHLICLACKSIEKVNINCQLKKEEKKINQSNKFIITNHSLDFYGYCLKCQSKNI